MWKSWPFVPWNSFSVFFSCSWSLLKFKPLFISLDFYMNALQNLHFLVFFIQISVFFKKLNLIISLPCLISIKDFSMLYKVQDKYNTNTHKNTLWSEPHLSFQLHLSRLSYVSIRSSVIPLCLTAKGMRLYINFSNHWRVFIFKTFCLWFPFGPH